MSKESPVKKPLLVAFVLVGLLVPSSASAQTQVARTWVSQAGSDANDCSYTNPCLSFQRATEPLVDGGEINAQTDGNFGELFANKGLTVDGRGHSVSITAFGDGVTINAPGKKVTLRNLHIRGYPEYPSDGIEIVDAAHVRLRDVTIRGMGGQGIDFRGAPHPARLTVTRSAITDNVRNGIVVEPTATRRPGAAKRVVVRDSEIDSNGANGIGTSPGTTTNPLLVGVFDSLVADNALNGLLVDGSSARARIGGNVIAGNEGRGILNLRGGQTLSYGRNRIYGNAVDGGVSSTVAEE